MRTLIFIEVESSDRLAQPDWLVKQVLRGLEDNEFKLKLNIPRVEAIKADVIYTTSGGTR